MAEMNEAESVLIGNPYNEFPEEIWEIILEQIYETEDILPVLQVFPQLRVLSERNSFSWFIGEILPFIFPARMEYADLKECRLVSKRWNNAVNTFLLTHPDRLPHNVAAETKVPETHFNYCRLPCITSIISGTQTLQRVVEAYTGQNPFPGRHVTIMVSSGRWRYMMQFLPSNVGSFDRSAWNDDGVPPSDAADMLKIVGHHVKHITFHFQDLYSDKSLLISQALVPCFRCLSFLPNLKSLRLTDFNLGTFDFNTKESQQLSDVLDATSFPFRLDSLSMSYHRYVAKDDANTKDILSVLVNHDRITKLVIQAAYWMASHGPLFPNLTELFLWASKEKDLWTVLNDLKCSHLRKLRVYTHDISVIDILDIISAYQVERLQIVGEADELETTNSSSLCQGIIDEMWFLSGLSPTHWRTNGLKSIRYLELQATPWLDVSFLRLLPNLEHIVFNMNVQLWERVDTFRPDEYPEIAMRASLHYFAKKEDDFPNNFDEIWKELANLKMLKIRCVPPSSQNTYYFTYAQECPSSHFCYVRKRNALDDEKEFHD